MTRPRNRTLLTSLMGLALLAEVRPESSAQVPPSKSTPERSLRSNVIIAFKPGQKMYLAIPWNAKTLPDAAHRYVGFKPSDKTTTWKHHKEPHIPAGSKILVFHVTADEPPPKAPGTYGPGGGPGTITVQATDTTGTTTTATFPVIQVDTSPCDE